MGCPRRQVTGFTQFLRTQTVPILDHGFVRLVRSGAYRGASSGRGLRRCRRMPCGRVTAAVGRRHRRHRPWASILKPMVGHLDVLDERGVPRVHGAGTLPHAPGLYFVGIEVGCRPG